MKKLKAWSKAVLSYCIVSGGIYVGMECVRNGWEFPFIIVALGLSAYFVFTDGELF